MRQVLLSSCYRFRNWRLERVSAQDPKANNGRTELQILSGLSPELRKEPTHSIRKGNPKYRLDPGLDPWRFAFKLKHCPEEASGREFGKSVLLLLVLNLISCGTLIIQPPFPYLKLRIDSEESWERTAMTWGKEAVRGPSERMEVLCSRRMMGNTAGTRRRGNVKLV